MEAVSNTTVLIALAKLNRLDLLENLFSVVRIHPAVGEELFANEEHHRVECALLREVMQKWLKVQKPHKVLECGLGKGEAEAIMLCQELSLSLFLSDDSPARTFAESLGQTPLGTIGVLVRNVHLGKITKTEYHALLDQLILIGMYLSTDVYQAARDAVK